MERVVEGKEGRGIVPVPRTVDKHFYLILRQFDLARASRKRESSLSFILSATSFDENLVADGAVVFVWF